MRTDSSKYCRMVNLYIFIVQNFDLLTKIIDLSIKHIRRNDGKRCPHIVENSSLFTSDQVRRWVHGNASFRTLARAA